MKMLKTALCAAVATVALTGAAQAADFSFNAGIANDYIFRGIDQTFDSDLQYFGGADVTQDALYAGVWLSNTGPDGDEALEYDVYAGYKPTYMGATFDFGLIYYGYTDSDNKVISSDLDTLELKAAVTYPVGPVALGGAVYYSPENGGFADESSVYVEANAAYTFEDGPTVNAAIGNYSFDIAGPIDSYFTWNVGATVPVGEHFALDFRYHDSDSDASNLFGPGFAGDQWIVTAKATF